MWVLVTESEALEDDTEPETDFEHEIEEFSESSESSEQYTEDGDSDEIETSKN